MDDTLAMNGLYSFTGFSGQGELYVKVADGVTGFRMFINNVEIDASAMAANGTYKIDYSALALDGTNTIQVTNIAPSTAKKAVTVYIPYPIVIDGEPEDVGMDASTLELVNDLIKSEVKYGFSGAQLAVIKDGRLVVSEAYGAANGWRQDGTRILPDDEDYVAVTKDTLYDLASNTKMYSVNYALQYILSTNEYDIGLDDPITKFFPQFDDEGFTVFKSGTSEALKAQIVEWKSQLTIRDILMHQAGFDPDPQYHNDKFNQATQKADPNVDNPLFSQERETTLDMVLRSPLTYQPGSKTVYSDVDYMLLCFILEQVTKKGLDEFLKEVFWDPMGLTHVTYNPLDNGFTKEQTAATELYGNTRGEAKNGPKILFQNGRTETVWGEVHDEKAYYAMEGISGHAGLYSNAEDLAKLCSLMLSGGYGGLKFFDKNIIDEFTKPKSTSNATFGLGWWREGNVGRTGYFTTHSSSDTIGHQGWTGTLTVIDPERNLVVVLLTNKKNSPVLNNTNDANDFWSDNMVLGNLGCVVGYVYESMDSSPEAMDASLAQFARDRIWASSTHKAKYDENVHMADAFALVDLVITRAEKRLTDVTLAYAKGALDDLKTHLLNSNLSTTGTMPDFTTKNCDVAAEWLAALEERVNAITEVATASAAPSLTPVEVPNALPMIKADGTYGSNDQNAVYFPRAYGTGTSTCYQNGVTWFESYEGQGMVYVAVRSNVSNLQIYINGVAVDTSAMVNLGSTKKIFAIDVSSVTVNGRNTIQVSGMPIGTTRGSNAPILVAVANQTVIDGGKPEDVGINPAALDLIDAIITSDVANGFTSAQLAVVKDGQLVYSNAWGLVNSYHPDGTPVVEGDPEYALVTTETLYDLASNTKMYATNYAIQKLVAGNQIGLGDKITKYLGQAFVDDTIFIQYNTGNGKGAPDLETAKAWKAELTVADLLQHQAGFAPDPQFHNDKFNQVTQVPDPDVDNPLYAIGKDAVKAAICKAPLVYQPGTKTVYSDVDYMLLGLIVEQVTGKSLDEYVNETFYKPLGLTHITYNPLDHGFEKDQIAATELNGNTRDGAIDFTGVRDYTLQGEVHDEKAWYAMGGVSGHAGLFSNAEDLARLAQATLNYSGYGPNYYWSTNFLDYFTDRKDTSATFGQGWWREGDMGRPWYFGVQSSRDTVGHQGWTGTLTVIDPESDLIIVYLTNKINSPVTDNTVNANKFDGNWYTSSTLGFVPNILYLGLQENDASNGNIQPALDALIADMAVDKDRLVSAAGDVDDDHPIVCAARAIWALIEHTVTYTDGTEDAEVFADQVYLVKNSEEDPVFNSGETTAAVDEQGNPVREGYLFTGWSDATDVNGNVVYTAQWTEDANGNGTPDDEEDRITVTYHIVHGTWSDGTAADKIVEILPGLPLGEIPTGTPNAGYTTPGTWSAAAPTADTVVNEDTTYTLTFPVAYVPPTYTYYNLTVKYVDEEGSELQGDSISRRIEGSSYTVTVPEIEGYTFDHAEGELTGRLNANVTVTLVYKAEEDLPEVDPPLVDEPDEPNPGDPPVDVPDDDPPLIDEPGTDEPGTDEPGTDEPGTDIPDEDPPLVDLPEDEPPQDDTPQTGDSFSAVLWTVLLLTSAGGLFAVYFTEKKKES